MGAEQSLQAELPTVNRRKIVSFSINGKMYIVDPERDKIGPETKLVDFIRDHALLKGTKFMCREGGCGLCVVSIKTRNPQTGQVLIRGINSCLVPVFSCDGWEISTVESIGSEKSGYHPFQQRLVKFHGTQCGFCTPGWIMHMYSLSQFKDQITVKDIEDYSDGNMCRCTGYRPILDAMKSLAVDASEELKRKCGGAGDAGKSSCCKSEQLYGSRSTTSSDSLEDFVKLGEDTSTELPIHLNLNSEGQWVKATDMTTLFLAIKEFQAKGLQFRILAGNTGTGVYKDDGPYQAYVEIKSIHTLGKIDASPSRLVLGGAVTISSAIDVLNKAATMEGYEYCKVLAKHWQRVANISVRNAATLAGNLMLKHSHREFPSDIFTTLETIGAAVTIASSASMQSMHALPDLVQMNMTGKIIYSIHFPKLTDYRLRTFKITRRYQNSHAYVNAGFLIKISPDNLKITESPKIVFGGISPNFIHATMTEKLLKGKTLNQATIREAMKTLDQEVQPDFTMPTDGQPTYRKLLTQSLLYKFILELMGERVSNRMKSGSMDLLRGLSYGKQTYDTEDKSEWPLYQPMQKLEAHVQCSGQAEYINDMTSISEELHGAFVLTKVASATLTSVDTSQAMKLRGVVKWVDHRHIPGVNNYMAGRSQDKPDLVFVVDKVEYAGQAVGVILAESREIALKAAKLVKLYYKDVKKPVLDIVTAMRQAEKAGKLNECVSETKCSTKSTFPEENEKAARATVGQHSLKGEFCTGNQIHFHTETQISICVPKEDGMDVFASTQVIDHVQNAIASCLALPANAINVYVKRLGGGLGGKLQRSAHVATACAVAAHAINRPVRLNTDLETNMSLIGKRFPFCYTYNVNFDDSGKIVELDVKMLCDTGCSSNETILGLAALAFQNVYEAKDWKLQPATVNTDLPPNTYCRAPGLPQAIATVEIIMDHIAFYLKIKPMQVRLTNLLKKGDPLLINPDQVLQTDNYVPLLLKELTLSADLTERDKFIAQFNQSNRWKKRGLAVMPMRSPCPYFFTGYYVHVSIYGLDGSIAVSHSGVEMGQGINTKTVQVVARELRVPMDKIKVKRADSMMGPNAAITGTAITSELICHSAMKACAILNERMAPVKAKLGNPAWEQLVSECKKVGVVMGSSYCTSYGDQLKAYDAWGMAATEVEIDCLTGEYKVIRSDLIFDAGTSISPDIDVGQVEGAFVMGMGMWTTEKVQYNQNTGELLTNRTWNYKPPMAKDIPEDFRITFLKKMPNQLGVFRSKATGEAPLPLSFSVFLALRAAIMEARADAGSSEWCPMDAPITPEDIQRFCLTNPTQFTV